MNKSFNKLKPEINAAKRFNTQINSTLTNMQAQNLTK